MTAAAPSADCPLCREAGGRLVWQGRQLRLIRADDALATEQHPAFYRLVWQSHQAELGDLDALQRATLLDALVLVEHAMVELLTPDKINLASLGNLVPHLHWHLIARWRDDPHWPQPVWAAPQHQPDAPRLHALRARLPDVDAELARRLQARFGAPD